MGVASERAPQYVPAVQSPEAVRLNTAEERSREPETDLAAALHEVSNALTVVLGWLDVAVARLPDSAPGANVSEALEVAQSHARLGHQIARRAIGADVSSPGMSQGSARAIARSAVVAVMPAAQRRGVRIELDDQRAGPALLGQAAATQQVLTNLLLNAIELSPDSSGVVLRVEDRADVVAFRISDCGPGIAPERQPDLFDGVPSTRSGGAGIGLRHSRALARAAGGDLELVSGQPHAVFELTWPIAELGSRPHGSAPPASALFGTCVLVVEDDAAVRALIELALDSRGVRTVVVGSAEEYRAVLQSQTHFDAALVDLSPIMEEVSDALAHLHAHSPGVRTILISGIASSVPDDVAVQVAAWVRKPFEMSEVIDALDRCLHKNPE